MNAEAKYEEAIAGLLAGGMSKPEAIRHIAINDPELNAARNEAYTRRVKAKIAESIDPIQWERAEAERLRALVQARHSGDGFGTRYIGETQPQSMDYVRLLNGMGYWHSEDWTIPWEAFILSDVFTCIDRIDTAENMPYAITVAMPLLTLIRQAQEACGEEPQPLAHVTMTPGEKSIVRAMWRGQVTTATDAQPRRAIVDLVDLHEDTVKDILTRFRERSIVHTIGERAGTRYYLAPQGIACGEYEFNRS